MSISPRMCRRPSFAWSSASVMIFRSSPSILMSIWIDVMPSFVPATLKSMSPRWSSVPRMSVRIAYFFPSLMSPIATPATAPLSGMPASKHESEPPQTEAIDDEPFDSSTSLTMRIVYGNSSNGGQHRLERALGEVAVADLAAAGAAHRADFAGRERREVVVEHERLGRLALVVDRVEALHVVRGAERRGDERLRLAAREERRAVRAREERRCRSRSARTSFGLRPSTRESRVEHLRAQRVVLDVAEDVRRCSRAAPRPAGP